MDGKLTGTKEVIFDIAVNMFALSGYENVSMRDIAKKVNIKSSSIYYYFNSKESILDYIYQYYTDHLFDNVKSVDEIKAVFHTGTNLDVIEASVWSFYGMPPIVHKRMTQITKIIYMRFIHDPKANKIFRDILVDETLARGKEILEYGVSIGKYKSDTDTTALAEVILYVRLMAGIVGITDNYAGGVVDKKDYLTLMLAKMQQSLLVD